MGHVDCRVRNPACHVERFSSLPQIQKTDTRKMMSRYRQLCEIALDAVSAVKLEIVKLSKVLKTLGQRYPLTHLVFTIINAGKGFNVF